MADSSMLPLVSAAAGFVGGIVTGVVTPALAERFSKWVNKYPRLSKEAHYLLICAGKSAERMVQTRVWDGRTYVSPMGDKWFGWLSISPPPDPFIDQSRDRVLALPKVAEDFRLAVDELVEVGYLQEAAPNERGGDDYRLTRAGILRYNARQRWRFNRLYSTRGRLDEALDEQREVFKTQAAADFQEMKQDTIMQTLDELKARLTVATAKLSDLSGEQAREGVPSSKA